MTFEEFSEKYNITLNDQQREAARTVEGPCLLLAVPGSGKTTVLVARLGYMVLAQNIPPENILTITYTVAATKDMSARFCKVFGKDIGEALEFRTINGICAKIIAWYSNRIGRASFDLEADESLRVRRITVAYQKIVGEYPSESDVQDMSSHITYIKNMMLNEAEIRKLDKKAELPVYDIFTAYDNSLKKDQKIDYDDQMVYAYKILTADKNALQYYQNKYRYICVDEAQDTSKIQHMIISLLAGRDGNLFMVGDEDQSIYGFRAAYPEALINFSKDHPSAKVLLMEENFRSTTDIVESADHFIKKNTLRHDKGMHAHRGEGAKVKYISIDKRSDQYKTILNAAKKSERQMAVLYRDNESVIPLVDMFDRAGIPFRIRNAELVFFTNKIVQDIVAVFRFILNNRDSESFLRIYYKFGMYLSKNDVNKIIARADGGSLLTPESSFEVKSDKARDKFISFGENIKELKDKDPLYALNFIIRRMGFSKQPNGNMLESGKIDILKEVFSRLNTIQEALDRLDQIKKLIAKNEAKRDCKVIFSTIHSSKGLEYDTVYILDAIDGVFPEKVYKNTRKLEAEKKAEYEEERRVFYVGITRAMDNLYVFMTKTRSTFVKEMQTPGKKTEERTEHAEKLYKRIVSSYKPYKKTVKTVPKMKFEDFYDELKKGRPVQHKKFGRGVIVSIEQPLISIRFSGRVRTMDITTVYENNLITLL